MRKIIILLLPVLVCTHLLPAQNGDLKGSISITDTAVLLQDVVVSLHRAEDSAIVASVLAEKNGAYHFRGVKQGRYFVSAVVTGYKKKYSNTFLVNSLHQQIIIPLIFLSLNVKELVQVTVTSQKPFIERKNDRLVVNVGSSIVSTGSTLLEVLEKSPGVLVNQESGINLKGKSGVNILADGKPIPLSRADLIAYLRSIPSANIDRIEIITNPSVKYDASGNAGIIDIRFKKDNREGYNGTAVLSFAQGVYSKPMAMHRSITERKNGTCLSMVAPALTKSSAGFILTGSSLKTAADLLKAFLTSTLLRVCRSRLITFVPVPIIMQAKKQLLVLCSAALIPKASGMA